MKILLAICLFNLCFNYLNSQVTISYKSLPISTSIRNPERGYYLHTEVFSKLEYTSLDSSTLNNHKSSNNSLVLRVIYLEKFLKSSISNEYIDAVKNDFALIRNAGLKCILRFAYSGNDDCYVKCNEEKCDTNCDPKIKC